MNIIQELWAYYKYLKGLTGYAQGHPFKWIDGKPVFPDGKNLFLLENTKPCRLCGKMAVNEMDACLGKLPGVKYACCGHGKQKGYISFENGITLRGFFTVERTIEENKYIS